MAYAYMGWEARGGYWVPCPIILLPYSLETGLSSNPELTLNAISTLQGSSCLCTSLPPHTLPHNTRV